MCNKSEKLGHRVQERDTRYGNTEFCDLQQEGRRLRLVGGGYGIQNAMCNTQTSVRGSGNYKREKVG